MSQPGGEHQNDNKKVLVAMSGGVDSSVAAALLKTQGFDVIGIHMQLWNHGDKNLERIGGRCCSQVDANDARRVCDQLEIPYYVINSQEVFQEAVVDYFVHEYLQARTPNPCVQCNTHIKFNYLFQKADELGCEYVATGHYAQVTKEPATGMAFLTKPVDEQKDQTYFLFGLTQKALQRTLMPLGGLSKVMVRKLADQFDLAIAEKPDSQEICFIGSEGYKDFIAARTTEELRPRGSIMTVDGTIVGDHTGLYKYTIGQRKGLHLYQKEYEGYYVVGFDTTQNTLIIGKEESLFNKDLIASRVNWLRPVDPMKSLRCKAKIRSRHAEAECEVFSFENGVVKVDFKEPQRAITPGQAVAFYENDCVIGGGFIDRVGVGIE